EEGQFSALPRKNLGREELTSIPPPAHLQCLCDVFAIPDSYPMNGEFSRTLNRGAIMNAIETHPVSRRQLTHLRMLEAEAIHILRETAAQFERPVLLYSIGKDSSVMLHLARRAFFPGKIPFPLMHIDTGYEYPEMIAFRDWFVAEIGAQLIARSNRQAHENGVHPYNIGT